MSVNEFGWIEPVSWVSYPTPDDDDFDNAEPPYEGFPAYLNEWSN